METRANKDFIVQGRRRPHRSCCHGDEDTDAVHTQKL